MLSPVLVLTLSMVSTNAPTVLEDWEKHYSQSLILQGLSISYPNFQTFLIAILFFIQNKSLL